VTYIVQIAESVKAQIKALPANQRALVLTTIAEQLAHEPLTETRNRKRMRHNSLAAWELRIGELRVYYDVARNADAESDKPGVVRILAVGRKEGNRLFIGNEEVEL
jgi:mRNA-degrading endonuclease RelE of RelBE toxin-antitoxin system